MGNESRRIDIKIGDDKEKNIKFKLDQNVKTMEILSLKLTQEDIFKSYNADYGVVIGRVIGNGAVGIPNAKVSIFIPLDGVDESNPIIKSIYPYKKTQDKNLNNKRYNLLPRISKANKPKQPFGSFPTKEEFLCDKDYLYVYEKYYKYSTITNSSGDYMIFGVPTGNHIIHMSVDITDIGKYSMSPISMVNNLGYSPNLFSFDAVTIKDHDDLTELPNIELQDISINVIPFWGDDKNYDIGITRQDFKIRAEIQTTFTLFGSCFTTSEKTTIGNPNNGPLYPGSEDATDGAFYLMYDENGFDVRANRNFKPKITVLSYKPEMDLNLVAVDGYNNLTNDDIFALESNKYASILNNGEFALVIPCNRKRMITDASGVQIEVDINDPRGVLTEFAGSILFDVDSSNNLPVNIPFTRRFSWEKDVGILRGRLKIPQGSNTNKLPSTDLAKNDDFVYNESRGEDLNWKKSYHLFENGKYYSVAQFFPTKLQSHPFDPNDDDGINNITLNNIPIYGGLLFKVSGVSTRNPTLPYDSSNSSDLILTGITSGYTGPSNIFNYQLLPNVVSDSIPIIDNGNTIGHYNEGYFGGQWLNMCLALPVVTFAPGPANDSTGRRDQTTSDMMTTQYAVSNNSGLPDNNNEGVFFRNNNQKITNTISDTMAYLRPRSFETAFIEVDSSDIDILFSNPLKGVSKYEYNLEISRIGDINSKYMYRPYYSGGNGYNNNAMDLNKYLDPLPKDDCGYIFKGMFDADCIKLLKNSGLI